MPPTAAQEARAPASVTPPLVQRRFREITEDILSRMGRGGPAYVAALGLTVLMMGAGGLAWAWQLYWGMGVTGLDHPIMWAVYIASFVWWIGIGHSGTMISAILYLFRAPFRSAFARAAEAMTIIAIITASAFPVIHVGRVWRGYWIIPYPNERGLWVTFRSPLVLDEFAIFAYLVVSAVFFWLGLVPDLAVVRDRAHGWARTLYGLLAAGWEGHGRQWKHYRLVYGLLAGLATALVILVHSVVSWDFSLAITPGWHSTALAPYFVIGAIFSGLAMVLTLVIPMRRLLRLEQYVTRERLDWLARLVLLMSLLLTFFYAVEYFITWYGRDAVEQANLHNKMFGAWATPFWTMTVCNSVLPLVLLARGARRSPALLFIVSLFINLGMWLERFLVVGASLSRDFLPYAWQQGGYRGSLVEAGILVGSLGFFLFWFLLFARYLPVLPMADLKRDWLRQERDGRAIRAALGADEP